MTPDPRPPAEYLLTTSIAASRLGVCRRTILRWIHHGTLAATLYPGGQWRVSASAIEKYRRQPGRSDDIAVDRGLTGDRRSLSPSRDA